MYSPAISRIWQQLPTDAFVRLYCKDFVLLCHTLLFLVDPERQMAGNISVRTLSLDSPIRIPPEPALSDYWDDQLVRGLRGPC